MFLNNKQFSLQIEIGVWTVNNCQGIGSRSARCVFWRIRENLASEIFGDWWGEWGEGVCLQAGRESVTASFWKLCQSYKVTLIQTACIRWNKKLQFGKRIQSSRSRATTANQTLLKHHQYTRKHRSFKIISKQFFYKNQSKPWNFDPF